MLNDISWGNYWTVLTILTFIYYSYVLLIYTRVSTGSRLQPGPSISLQEEDALFPVAQNVSDEMMAYLEQASHAKVQKPELIYGLQQIAKKYKDIKDSTYQSAINKVIILESNVKCAFRLSGEDVRQVWLA